MNTTETVARQERVGFGEGSETRSGRVLSRDGASIAFDRVGEGPPVIVVVGALCSRALGPGVKLAPALAGRFAVFTYDRRGRGESTGAGEPSVEREVEDLDALIRRAGGPAFVVGHSSGAALALHAAARGLAIERVALYEAPFIVDGSRPSTERDWVEIGAHLAAGRRGDAVKAFLRSVGVPGLVRALMPWTPMWARLTAVAGTLPYDGALVGEFQRGEPLLAGRWADVKVPALVLSGGKSPAWMQTGARALAAALPHARHRTLEGQTHDVRATALAPVLTAFFGADA